MKICFTSDLHGSPSLYAQLIQLVLGQQPNILILGGDQCPTEFGRNAILHQQHWLETEFDLFLNLVRPICRVIWASGNHDLFSAYRKLQEFKNDGLVEQCDNQTIAIGQDWSVVGFPYGPVTEGWIYKDWERRDEKQRNKISLEHTSMTTLYGKLEEIHTNQFLQSLPTLQELLQKLPLSINSDHTLFLSHYPPYKSKLDESARGPIGSRAIQEFLRNHSFTLACTGHVHESPYLTGKWMHQSSKTICVNPGQWGETLHAVLFDTDELTQSLTHTIFGPVNTTNVFRLSRKYIRQEQQHKWKS